MASTVLGVRAYVWQLQCEMSIIIQLLSKEGYKAFSKGQVHFVLAHT